MEELEEPECSHIWRPFWAASYISHYVCDKCGEYHEEDDYGDE